MSHPIQSHRCLQCCIALFLLLCGQFSLVAEPVEKVIRWQEVPYSGGYIIEVQSAVGVPVLQRRVRRPPLRFRLAPGKYRLRIMTLNRWGKSETATDWVAFTIEDPKPLPEPQVIARAEQEKHQEEGGGILIPRPERYGLGPFLLTLKKFVDTEVYLYMQPEDPLLTGSTPHYYNIAKYRLGIKNFIIKGLSFGAEAGIFALSRSVNYYKKSEVYNIPTSYLYGFDISYRIEFHSNLYFVAHAYPFAKLYRISAQILDSQGRARYVSPFNYTTGLDQVQFRVSNSVFYIEIWDNVFGGAFGIQAYSPDQYLVLNLLGYIWVSYDNFDTVDLGIELSVGLRL